MSEFDSYSIMIQNGHYQPMPASNNLLRTAPKEDGLLQKVIRGVRLMPIPEDATVFRLNGKATKYEGLRDMDLFPLKDLVDLDEAQITQLADDMKLHESEILVVTRNNGNQHLAKVDRKLLSVSSLKLDALVKNNRQGVDTLDVRSQFDDVFKKT